MANYRVMRVARDMNGNIISTSRIGKMSVIMDEENDISEMALINKVEVTAFALNKDDGFCQIVYRLGGRTNNGTFHVHDKFKPGMWAFNRKVHTNLWIKYIEGKNAFNLNDMLDWAYDEGVIKVLGKNSWDIPDIEMELVVN